MASDKQVSANRRNGSKSTGPKTQNGKLQSRRNAMRHGLTATTVVTAFEDVEEFERFEAAIRADYQPVSTIEHELVARLIALLWRLRRAALIETNLFALQSRIATGHTFGAQVGSDIANPGLGTLYQFLRSPNTLVPSDDNSNGPEFTIHGPDVANAQDNASRYPDPATIFLRLCNLSSFPIDRINRYETGLWRQVAQMLFILDTCKKRSPSP